MESKKEFNILIEDADNMKDIAISKKENYYLLLETAEKYRAIHERAKTIASDSNDIVEENIYRAYESFYKSEEKYCEEAYYSSIENFDEEAYKKSIELNKECEICLKSAINFVNTISHRKNLDEKKILWEFLIKDTQTRNHCIEAQKWKNKNDFLRAADEFIKAYYFQKNVIEFLEQNQTNDVIGAEKYRIAKGNLFSVKANHYTMKIQYFYCKVAESDEDSYKIELIKAYHDAILNGEEAFRCNYEWDNFIKVNNYYKKLLKETLEAYKVVWKNIMTLDLESLNQIMIDIDEEYYRNLENKINKGRNVFMGNLYVNNGNANVMGESNIISNCSFNSISNCSNDDLDKIKKFIGEIEKSKSIVDDDKYECINALNSMLEGEKNNNQEELSRAKERWKTILRKVGVNTLSGLAITSNIITVGTPLFKMLFM